MLNPLGYKRFTYQNLFWSMKFVIQINLGHGIISVWNFAEVEVSQHRSAIPAYQFCEEVHRHLAKLILHRYMGWIITIQITNIQRFVPFNRKIVKNKTTTFFMSIKSTTCVVTKLFGNCYKLCQVIRSRSNQITQFPVLFRDS